MWFVARIWYACSRVCRWLCLIRCLDLKPLCFNRSSEVFTFRALPSSTLSSIHYVLSIMSIPSAPALSPYRAIIVGILYAELGEEIAKQLPHGKLISVAKKIEELQLRYPSIR